ncbi:ferric-rhodotorulic acid/ferric-coprogen receptor FhuE [Coralloluteibacterium stylophorae]|uniref:Ferric-rhodotorulic acid/ferric-coprogen receptor FhuE n=1 Tax=Coralloluteibacterium stylophorae TaxID=1776034 RepID=A0A8J7VSK1_9GAMM|nr:ferric-rhodotorulic acid/ferric-coprogen receptor FhuE [Coralloluteibacterium stylophorae]MBS7456894.1 ferric-rhodotorulic acid/ferric-coprogen receptor FhuE [Coralloluteibacterium stylophorae]
MTHTAARRRTARALRRAPLHPALLVALCLGAAPAWAQQTTVEDEAAVTLQRLDVEGERVDDGYTVDQTRAGTRFDLELREIPQSVTVVTRQRMDDQNLLSIGEVLSNVTGVSGTYSDSERLEFYARGFYIDNFQFDGIPTTMDQAWSYGDSALDLALYERVEIVRGATGLLTGAGNPSASVNLIRKHADSRVFTGSVSLGIGNWSRSRGVADVSVPLNADGSVRSRVVASYQDGESHMDRYALRKKLAYAVIDADLGADTVLSIGHDYQKKESDDVTWGGFPIWYADGTRTDYGESFNPAADWTFWDTTVRRSFASLEHGFASGWSLRANATHDESEADNALFYPFYTIYGFDPDTGGGVVPYSGRYNTQREVDGLDAYAEGPFQAFGREHELMLGLSRNQRDYVNNGAFDFPGPLPTYLDWTGAYPQPAWGELPEQSRGTITQNAAYAAARFSLADPLSLILGARHTDWESEDEGADRSHDVTTPYAGLVWDIDGTWSTYLSYTDIFQPQSLRYASGAFLDPVEGMSYEAGVKAAWFDDRLNASLAVFRIEQDNVAQATGELLPNGEAVYRAAEGTVSEGYDFELTGRLAAGWDATFGVSHYTARDAGGASINTQLPRSTVKLFTSYTPQALPALTVGGGVNWQNRTYYVDAVYGEFEQDPYALASLFARYRITPQLSAQINVDNLFDEEYYSQFNSGYGAWGAPRGGMATLTWAF